MSTNYSLLFYLKKPKNYVSSPKPIYIRITMDGIPKELSTGKDCDPSKWNPKANRAKGTKEDIKTLNAYLDTLEHKIADIHLHMIKSGAEITAESIKLKYLGKNIQRKTWMQKSDYNLSSASHFGKNTTTKLLLQYCCFKCFCKIPC